MGELALRRDGDDLALPNSRKTRALLVWLLLNPGPTRRDRLCEIFWQVPDDPRGSLRWSLSKLRGLVDEPDRKRIIADREHVSFDPTDIQIDLLAFRQRVSAGLDNLTLTELAELAESASDQLLPGLDLADQPEFSQFLAAERESFRQTRVAVLLELTRRTAGETPSAEIVQWHQDLVAEEPYSVDAHVRLIETLARAGRTADAERQLAIGLRTLGEIAPGDRVLLELAAARPAMARPASSDSEIATVSSPPPAPLEQVIRYCRATDGTRIAYAAVGDGPPLIKAANWLNHLEFDWESPVWRHVFHALAEGRTLVRYDARGNGLSDWNVDDFSLDRQIADLEAVVEASGLDRFALLGLSQGCAVSAEFAARYPEKVSRLVLIGGYARGWKRIGTPDVIRQTEAMITLVGMGWGQDNPAFRQMFTSMFMPDAPPENQSWFNELQRNTTTPENAARLIHANGEVDVLERLADVQAPTLVMHAEHDMRIPFNSGREMAAGIPGARFVGLPSRNHLMPEGDPAWPMLLDELNAFLSP